MRIILGKNKGRRIVAPKKLPVRPTTDMAKEALFNILNNWYYFSDVSVLDLFSGTGNISYEFISRGCSDVTAVEQNKNCVSFIHKTTEELNYKDFILILKQDVYRFLERQSRSYHIIFADPPYDIGQDYYEKIHKMVYQKKMLREGGVLILEHNEYTKLEHLPFYDTTKRYGGIYFSIFDSHSKTNEEE